MILQEKLNLLKQEFVEKSADYNSYTTIYRTKLEAEFMIKIGNRKLELLELQFQIFKTQRKIEEISKVLAKNEKPELAVIEAHVTVEMAEMQEQINKKTTEIKNAHIILNNITVVENIIEVRNEYFKLAKKLHPDIVENFSEKHKQIWEEVQQAYEEKNIDKLKSISLVYEDFLNQNTENETTDEDLQKKIDTLIISIKKINDNFLVLKDQFPYALENKLEDEEWINSQNNTTEELIIAHQKYWEILKIEYQNLINEL